MTEIEKAYIAGIIDGEGSIMLIKFHNNQLPSPCVTVSSSTIELLEWIKSRTGAGTIKSKKNYKPDVHKDSFTYEVKYDKAVSLLSGIYPSLTIDTKKKKAELIITMYKKLTPRNGRYSPSLLKAKNKFYNDFVEIK
jgi:hypothetical protein